LEEEGSNPKEKQNNQNNNNSTHLGWHNGLASNVVVFLNRLTFMGAQNHEFLRDQKPYLIMQSFYFILFLGFG